MLSGALAELSSVSILTGKQLQIVADLQERRIPYIVLRGSLVERMAIVGRVLAGFRKYRNFYGEKVGTMLR
jgi:hypothetical protein